MLSTLRSLVFNQQTTHNLNMTYLYPIQNCFQPPSPPKKKPTIYQFFCQVNFQLFQSLLFPVCHHFRLSHTELILSYQWATKVIYTRLTFCLGQFTEGFHRPNVTQNNPQQWLGLCTKPWADDPQYTPLLSSWGV